MLLLICFFHSLADNGQTNNMFVSCALSLGVNEVSGKNPSRSMSAQYVSMAALCSPAPLQYFALLSAGCSMCMRLWCAAWYCSFQYVFTTHWNRYHTSHQASTQRHACRGLWVLLIPLCV